MTHRIKQVVQAALTHLGAELLLFTEWNRFQGEHFAPQMKPHRYPMRDRVALKLLQHILITLFKRKLQLIALDLGFHKR